MSRLRGWVWVIVMLVLWGGQTGSAAQFTDFSIAYGETQSAFFDNAIRSHRWRFTGMARDLLEIEVQRIAGQFVPQVRLLDVDGNVVTVGDPKAFPDTAILTLLGGLPADGLYQIEVLAQNVVGNQRDNPAEYGLTLTSIGRARASRDEGLSPLPEVGLTPLPQLQVGSPTRTNIGIDVYGPIPQVERSDTPNIPARFLVRSAGYELIVNNTIPIARGVVAASFSAQGVGIVARNAPLLERGSDRVFFSDQGFTIAYNSNNAIYTFTLADGTIITTDFFQIDSIEVREGSVAARVNNDGTARRLVFTPDNERIDLLRFGGGTPDIEAISRIRVSDTSNITSDLRGFDTLAVVGGQLRVYYGDDGRLLSQNLVLDLRQNDANPARHDYRFTFASEGGGMRDVLMSLEWRRMGDVRLDERNLAISPLDSRTLVEPLATFAGLTIREGAVRIERLNGSVRTSFPDGTDMSASATLSSNSALLPYQPGFRPRNANNLGRRIFPMCPCAETILEHTPVNPANGNFTYQVTDLEIPSHTVGLQFQRTYNSMDVGATPAHLLGSGRYPGQLGDGWRHSYQYDLDVSAAALGRIRLVTPDGTQYLFAPTNEREDLWRSATLLSWRLERIGGPLGTWEAVRNDGTRYYFDRSGHLRRISEAPQRSVVISRLPQAYDIGGGGAFIVEPYGRRMEVYVGASGRIEQVRDTVGRQIRYGYDGTRLAAVEIISPTLTAQYEYGENGLLSRVDDPRSEYTQQFLVRYDDQQRAVQFVKNPEGASRADVAYSYQVNPLERVTSRISFVNGQRREESWIYNDNFQLVRKTTPRPGFDTEFSYDDRTGLLATYRVPTLTRYRFAYDDRGNLVQFEDPFFTGDRSYGFTYTQQGDHSLLTQIRYPNNGVENFTWSQDADPQLLAHTEQVRGDTETITRTTRYEYDGWARPVLVIDPLNVATLYEYDEFGYVAAIWQGITLAAGETRADISDRNRARRVLQFETDLIGQVRAVTDGRGARYTLNYDSLGNLRSITDPNEATMTYTYDDRGRITLVDNRGRETQYTYDGLDNVASIVDAAGAVLTYTYDEVGNLLSVVDDLQRRTDYRYDTLDHVTRVVSPSGLVTQYETRLVDGGDFLERREVDSVGRTLTRRFDSLNRLRRYTITDGDFQQQFTINYNASNRPVEIIETNSGRTLTLEYDLVGQVRALAVAGFRQEFAYDASGRLVRVVSPANRVTTFGYDPVGNLTRTQTPDGRTRTYTYDENNNLLQATEPGGGITRYVYDALNYLISEENPAGETTTYEYDVRGNLINLINPLLVARSFRYDDRDRLSSATDGRGRATTYNYDEIGRLIEIERPGVRSTRLTYDAEDNIIAITERPREQRTLYSYDGLSRVTSITDPLGHTTSYTYNPIGRVERIVDPVGNLRTYEWRIGGQSLAGFTDTSGREYAVNVDALGRATLVRDLVTNDTVALNTQFSYDDDGFVRSIQVGTDQARSSGVNDTLHRYTYDAVGNVISHIDARDETWGLTYNNAGWLVEVVNPNGVPTAYDYDSVGRIIRVRRHVGTPVETVEAYARDANGNITRYVGPDGVVSTYQYDQNDRLLRAVLAVDTPAEAQYLFEYNEVGQLTRAEDPSGSATRYLYSLNNITRVEREQGDATVVTGYTYDDANNLRTIILPGRNEATNAPLTINQTYDALDQRVRYVNGEDGVWSYTYDLAGNVTQISDPLGSVVQYRYDTQDRVTNITYPTGSTVDIGYDTAGNLRTITLPPNEDGNRQTLTYVLDIAGNVLEMQNGGSITRYEYDALGNAVRRTQPDGSVTEYAYDAAGRLIAVRYADGETLRYSYDELGRLRQADGITFDYDALGRLVETENRGLAIAYSYDVVGNLTRRDAGIFGLTEMLYDDANRVIEMTFEGQSVRFGYDESDRLRQILRDNGVRTIINYNAVGSPITILHLGPDNERLDGFNYQYDAVGNLIRIDRVIDGWRVLFSYDVSHRLIDERWLNELGETVYAVSFRYDAAGNRVEELRNGRRTEFFYNAQNQLIREDRAVPTRRGELVFLPFGVSLLAFGMVITWRRRPRWGVSLIICGILGGMTGLVFAQTTPTTLEYTYDRNGHLSRVRTLRTEGNFDLNYRYDREGRLIQVQGQRADGARLSTEYTYDIFSRLVAWRAGTETANFIYDDRSVLAKTDTAGAIERYLQTSETRFLTLSAGDALPLWHLNDHTETTRKVVAGDEGQLADDPMLEREFSSFGVRIFPYNDGGLPEGADVQNPESFFAGMLYDPSTDHYLTGLRAYEPDLGRYLQPDPVRQDPFGTLYTYARNRPLVFSDPQGMMAEPRVEPLDAAALSQSVTPDQLIPQPVVPEFPVPERVQYAQNDELFRPLQLYETLVHETNDVVASLSPLLDDFYLLDVNPMPDAVRDLHGQPLAGVMALYDPQRGWLPDPSPVLSEQDDPLALFAEIAPLFALAYRDPLAWCGGDLQPQMVDLQFLPTVPQPQGLAPSWQAENDLVDLLQSVPIMTALDTQTAALATVNAPQRVPDMALPTIDLPSAPIEPIIVDHLDALREQTYRLNRYLIDVGFDDCDGDCVDPLRFSN